VEQVSAGILSSTEFAGRADAPVAGPNADDNFVRARYHLLLSHTPQTAELSRWTNALPTLGRTGVAERFLSSAEYRTRAVRTLYGDVSLAAGLAFPFLPNLLRRTTTPRPQETAARVNGGRDLFSVELALASSAEYYARR
jgi:hypothetical protein